MNYPEIKREQLNSLKAKFLAFLKDVSLRSIAESRHRGSDGLYHFSLQFQGDKIQLEEPNSYGDYQRGSQFLSLQWGDEALDSAVTEAQRLCPHVSQSQIRIALRNLMVKMFHEQVVSKGSNANSTNNTDSKASNELQTILDILDTSNIEQELREVIQRLRSSTIPQTVCVPIEGLKLSGRMRIGEVELHPINDQGELEQILGIIEEQREQESTTYAREVLKHASCYAIVKSIGDNELVRNGAKQKVREALHILNFCLSSSMHQPSWERIRISSIVVNRGSPTANPDDDVVGLHEVYAGGRLLDLAKSKLLDVVRPAYNRLFSAQPSQQHSWQEERDTVEQGLEKLLTCFQINSDIARRFQRAITWYSKAVDADTPEEQFVNLVIALEGLLIGDEGRGPYATTGSISQNLGERVAFLLEDDFENRIKSVAETKELYERRSAIVHRGESVTKEDLSKMDRLVKQVIIAFWVHDFDSWPAFQGWIAKQKFEKRTQQRADAA